MCSTVKSPTPKDPEKKDPIYLRNPYLDGLGINGEALGRNSLRIDMGARVPRATDPRTSTIPTTPRFPGLPGGLAGLGIGLGGAGTGTLIR